MPGTFERHHKGSIRCEAAKTYRWLKELGPDATTWGMHAPFVIPWEEDVERHAEFVVRLVLTAERYEVLEEMAQVLAWVYWDMRNVAWLIAYKTTAESVNAASLLMYGSPVVETGVTGYRWVNCFGMFEHPELVARLFYGLAMNCDPEKKLRVAMFESSPRSYKVEIRKLWLQMYGKGKPRDQKG